MSMIINPYVFSSAPVLPSTWDASLKGANVILSNSDLDATKAGAGYQSVYGTQGRSAGRYAFEIITTAQSALSTLSIGIADKTNTAGVIATYLGNNGGPVETVGYNAHTSNRYYRRMTVGNVSGTTMSGGVVNAVSTVMTVDVNFASNTVTFYQNGTVLTPSGIAVTSGVTYFPAASIQSGSAVRLRTTGLTYLPSGAAEWG